MRPLSGFLFVRPQSRDDIFKLTFRTIETVLPPQAYGEIVDMGPNVSGLVVGELIAYTLAAVTTFEADGTTYHAVPAAHALLVLEGAGA